jgi:hypothetical protein
MRLDCPKFHFSRCLRSTTFELLLQTISTLCQPNRHTKCTSLILDKSRTSEFLRLFFDLITFELDIPSKLLEDLTSSTRVKSPTPLPAHQLMLVLPSLSSILIDLNDPQPSIFDLELLLLERNRLSIQY